MPTEECMRYEMKRVMKGYIYIIYLDENFRITNGNQATIVIVKKVKNEGQQIEYR